MKKKNHCFYYLTNNYNELNKRTITIYKTNKSKVGGGFECMTLK